MLQVVGIRGLAVAFAVAVVGFCACPAGAGVAVAKRDGGGFTVSAANYTAVVGADGNLHSLVSDNTEFLCDNYRGVMGGSYLQVKEAVAWSATAFAFAAVSQAGPDTLVATADNHKLTYRFQDDGIDLRFSHTAEPTIWFLAVNPALRDVLERGSGEAIAFKSVREGAPHLFAASGANVALPHGAFWYIARNAREKPDTDPMLLQVWMPRTAPGQELTQRITVHAKPTVSDALQARLSVPCANHLFPGAAPATGGLSGRLRFPGVAVAGELELTVREFLSQAQVLQERKPFALAAGAEATVSFSFTPKPGFYDGTLILRQHGEVLATRTFPFGYDMARLPLPERPADFDAFWDQTLAEQAKVPPNLQLTVHKEEAAYTLYKFRFDGVLGRQFHGWLAAPKAPGKYPAHLTLPPSGVNPPYLPYSGPNIVGMTLAIAGQEPEPPAGGYKHWDYWRSGIESRETWYYRAVFAACSRAIDLLAARPDVDAARLSVAGGSQGGGLAFITAALNPKVAVAVSGSPGLFGLEWKLRFLGYNWWPPIHIGDDPKAAVDPAVLEARIAVARYGDAANFAPRIQCAVLLCIGLQDVVTSQAAVLAAWPRLKNARVRALLADPWGGHNGPRGGQMLTSLWLQTAGAGDVGGVTQFTTADVLPVLIEKR